ncbi:MAG: molybdopterin-dependent oxidoreductase, partial [Burkholderiaceae bacterium]|nr:molybdopterin-dependent oxidoreductase [Burkholderiaceae bacterium]
GKPGAGPLSLTGQPNAMGGREVGGLATLLSAHRDLADPQHRAEVAALWGVPAVPATPGKAALQMFQAAADGEIKALWIACTNPAQSLPDQATVRRALQRAEFVVLQEAFTHTATAAYADLLLPASSWGEKEGTVTNSERRISRVRAAIAPPGEARADWAIAVAVAQRLEARLRPGLPTLFPYQAPEEIWNEHRESTRGRDLDITGLSYAALEQRPQQWPYAAGAAQGSARLYADGRFATADGRASFAAPAWRAVAEARDARFPVALNTGRQRDQWHAMSRTGTLGRLFAHAGEPAVELHPQELARRRLRAGDLVRISSRRGTLLLPAQANEAVAPAQAFVAMHWGSEFLAGEGVNALTSPATCPQSQQPELKHAAVRIERAELRWQIAAAAWLPADEALATRERLRALFDHFPYASCLPFGREPDTLLGLRFRAALPVPAEAPLLRELESALGLADGPVLRYADARSGQSRAMALGSDGALRAFVLAGDTAADDWVLELLRERAPAAAFGRALLAASRQPPQALAPRSPQVCACHDVSERRIVQTLSTLQGGADARLQALQQRLRCGTQCGSCLPALRGLVQRRPTLEAAA